MKSSLGVSAMPPYRILVVDDSAFMRKIVSDIITGDKDFIVVGSAHNGKEAIEAVKQHRPDAVTLDVEMPEMTGLEALPVIMREAPTPVVMMSSSTHEGATATFQALELGAFDFVAKPSSVQSLDLDRVQESLLQTLRAAVIGKKEEVVERLKPQAHSPLPPPVQPIREAAKPAPPKPAISKPAIPPAASATAQNRDSALGKTKRNEPGAKPADTKPAAERKPSAAERKPETPERAPPIPVPAARKSKRVAYKLVAIGTSTGGPRALQQVLTRLPADFPASILIVQHMPPGFTKSLAQRLNTLCAIEVAEAEDGMEPLPGTAYIAPGGLHMTLRKEAGTHRLRLTSDPPRGGHRPSVDTLFESLAAFPELDRTIVLMTGMGSDGARGMKLLYDQGVHKTIAEDQSSCIVYGMPRAAVELQCVSHTVPLDRIASQISKEVT
jgi:two-component system chemotaxis response regulator CheB